MKNESNLVAPPLFTESTRLSTVPPPLHAPGSTVRPLKLFTDPTLLRHMGRPLLSKLFDHFSDVLPHKHFLPNPRPDNEAYFDSLAVVIGRTGELPDTLARALREIEQSVSENLDGVTSLDNNSGLLSQAIESWLQHQCSPPSFPSPSPSAVEIVHQDNSGLAPVPQPAARCSLPSADGKTDDAPRSDDEIFLCLAQLSSTEYDRVRHSEAKRLHLRIQTLDSEVARRRAELSIQTQANSVKLPSIEPWPEPVIAAEVFSEVAARFSLYIVLPPGAADASALWIGHCHAVGAFHLSPRLNFNSPRQGCGKTTAFDVLTTMVPRPLRTENISAPVLFRLVDQHQPTLLLDEVDAYLPQAEELRGLLNAGHKRGACAYRCEGDGKAVRAFNAFAPAALAGIGSLPATLRDRSILVPLVPAQEGQIPVRFDPLQIEIESALARKLTRWAKDNFHLLVSCNPPLPPGAFNRLADNWRPLLAVATVAGGDWPARALAAFEHLTQPPPINLTPPLSPTSFIDPSDQTLLADLYLVFECSRANRIFSAALLQSLQAIPNRPYSLPQVSLGEPTKFTTASLARRLKAFGIRPQNMTINGSRAKGYKREDFIPIFARIHKTPST